MTNDNSHTITGTVFAKEYTQINGVKKPGEVYDKYTITLEVKTGKSYEKNGKTEYHTSTTFPQLEAFGINLDHIDIGDLVTCSFFMQGKKYTNKAGQEKIMTKAMITYVKHADLDSSHDNHKGKIKIDSFSDSDDLVKKKDGVTPFPPPDDNDFGDLPFIITALIGIGSLMIF